MKLLDKIKVLIRKRRYNNQYIKGEWDYLNSNQESARYLKIVEYIKLFGTNNPSILDLGSGEGVLNTYLAETKYDYFLGTDFSSDSIQKAKQKLIPNSEFKVADIHNFKPNRTFDVIIFNEVFYYIQLTEREHVLNTMIESLNENGILIVSIFKEGNSCWEFFDNDNLKQLEFTTVKTKESDIFWKIGVYTKT